MRKITREYLLLSRDQYCYRDKPGGLWPRSLRPVELDQAMRRMRKRVTTRRSPAVLQSPCAKLKKASCAPSRPGIKRKT
jgi:hypothetical protein